MDTSWVVGLVSLGFFVSFSLGDGSGGVKRFAGGRRTVRICAIFRVLFERHCTRVELFEATTIQAGRSHEEDDEDVLRYHEAGITGNHCYFPFIDDMGYLFSLLFVFPDRICCFSKERQVYGRGDKAGIGCALGSHGEEND